MTQNNPLVKLPPPDEIGLEVARLGYLREVVDQVPSLRFADEISIRQAVSEMARTIRTGTAIHLHADFETLVLSELHDYLPSGKLLTSDSLTLRDQSDNKHLANAMSEERPLGYFFRMPKNIPANATPERIIHSNALVTGLERVGMVRREKGIRRVFWPVGTIAAAGFYRANILDKLDREAYEIAEEIDGYARDFRTAVRPRMVGSRIEPISVYELLDQAESTRDPKIKEVFGHSDSKHDLLWEEATADMKLFADHLRKLRSRSVTSARS